MSHAERQATRQEIADYSAAAANVWCAMQEVENLVAAVLGRLRTGNATSDILAEVTESLDAAADALTSAEGRLR